jgi:mRNA-degrading endonuclease YafQ of YafQ-DinJ toxin-antitoxin module
MSSIILKNINIKDVINTNYQLLTIKELLTSINYNLDNIYIDRFWYSIQDDKWIYLDNELILWLEYKDVRRGKEFIIRLLKQYFIENEDYKILSNSEFDINNFCSTIKVEQNYEEEKRGAHNKQYITVSPDCFKELCMHVGTIKSKEIKKYYIELEKVFKFYLEYQNEYRKLELENKQNELENKNNELEEKENIINEQKDEINNVKEKIVNLSNHLYRYNELKENTYLYVATNKHLGLQNNFKVGVSTQLTKRLINYNCNNNVNDAFYFTYAKKVHNAYVVEYMIKHILKEFKNSNCNEIFVINHDYLVNILDNIINNYSNTISYYNLLMKDYVFDNTISNNIPPAINVNSYIKFNYQTDFVSTKPENTEAEVDENTIYYNHNKEFTYLKYKNENNKNLFKCLRCNYIFNRIDNLQNHFNRQVKCYETEENIQLKEVKNNNESPVIKCLEESDNYTFYEKYNNENNCIQYYCNNCEYNTDNFNILKKHYLKRKIKCYDEVHITSDDILIYKDSTGDEFEYKKIKTNVYECNHCKYVGSKANIIRHYNKKIKCKYLNDYKILKETENAKYYVIYKNQKKSYQCFYCDFETEFQHSLPRHRNNSINKCND